MAVDVWPYENQETSERWRDIGPVANVYIGTLGGDDRPKGRNNQKPPEPTPEEVANAEPPNCEPAGHTALRYWDDRK